MLNIFLSAALMLFAPQQQPQRGQLALPPSTMSDPIYVMPPITIEVVNMEPQVLADMVASGKIAVDGANHLNIPQGPLLAKLGPDMLRPTAQGDRIPANSAEKPLKAAIVRVPAPSKFVLVTKSKTKLVVQGNRLVLTEIK